MSGRFVVLLTTLWPTPSAWKILCIYCPLCWQRLRECDPPRKENPAEVDGPARVCGGAVVMNVAGEGGLSSTSLTPGRNAQKVSRFQSFPVVSPVELSVVGALS